jgi:hypothetical protein
LVTVLAALVSGEDRAVLLSPDWKPLQILNDSKPLHPLIQEVAQRTITEKLPTGEATGGAHDGLLLLFEWLQVRALSQLKIAWIT